MSNKSSNRVEVPEAKEALDRFKTEVASELGISLKEGYNGDLTSREAGSIGGVQSDQGLVVTFGHTPCILFGCGRRGLPGSSHLPNEIVEEVRLHETYHTILEFVKG